MFENALLNDRLNRDTLPSMTEAQAAVEATRFAMSAGQRIVGKLTVIDFRPYETLSPETAVSQLVRGSARHAYQATSEALRLLSSLPALTLGIIEEDNRVSEPEFELWSDAEGAPIEGVAAPESASDLDQDVDEALARLTERQAASKDLAPEFVLGVWQMLGMQLKQCRNRLEMARRNHSKWGMITSGEECQRKAVKALRRALPLAAQMVQSSDAVFVQEQDSEIEISLKVREKLLLFRDNLLSLTADLETLSEDLLSSHLSKVQKRIQILMGDPIFSTLRAYDRYALYGLSQRCEQVQGNAEECLRLLSDVRAFSELLRDVNHRERLLDHDRQVRTRALEDLKDLMGIAAVSDTAAKSRFLDVLTDAKCLRHRNPEIEKFFGKDTLPSLLTKETLLVAIKIFAAAVERVQI